MAGPAGPAAAAWTHNAMEPREFALLKLTLLPGLSPRGRAELRTADDLPSALSAPAPSDERLPPRAREALRSGEVDHAAEREALECRRNGVRLLYWGGEDYPALLKSLKVHGILEGAEILRLSETLPRIFSARAAAPGVRT